MLYSFFNMKTNKYLPSYREAENVTLYLEPASKLSRVIVEFGWLISIVVVYSNGPDSVVP